MALTPHEQKKCNEEITKDTAKAESVLSDLLSLAESALEDLLCITPQDYTHKIMQERAQRILDEIKKR